MYLILTNTSLSYNPIMIHYFLMLWIFVFFPFAHGVDERIFRSMLTGKFLENSTNSNLQSDQSFSVSGKKYLIDLDGDGIEEFIIPQKRDGVDWLEIRDSSLNVIFSTPLFAMGTESHLYKIKFVTISSGIKALILFQDEGTIEGKRFESSAKLYVVSFEKNNLKNMKLFSGPHFFHEKASLRDIYFRRDYQVSVVDLNGDKKKEIVVHFNHIQRILQYDANGNWKRY